MARASVSAYCMGMDRDAKIAELKTELAAKRQSRQDWLEKRINLTSGELHALNRSIHEDEQFLQDSGVSDA